MKIEYNVTIEKANQVFLFEANKRVKSALKNIEYAQKHNETLRIDRESLKSFKLTNHPDSYILAENLIKKIDYILGDVEQKE